MNEIFNDDATRITANVLITFVVYFLAPLLISHFVDQSKSKRKPYKLIVICNAIFWFILLNIFRVYVLGTELNSNVVPAFIFSSITYLIVRRWDLGYKEKKVDNSDVPFVSEYTSSRQKQESAVEELGDAEEGNAE